MGRHMRFFPEILIKALQAYLWLPSRFVPMKKMSEVLLGSYRKNTSNVVTFKQHNFLSISKDKSSTALHEIAKRPDIGIVLQGPIRHEYSFTMRTIEMYLSNFSGSPIILSTWDNEDVRELQLLAAENSNLHIVLQKKPQNSGISNINLQINSTKVGLEKLQELKIRYAVKTRTDQCMFDPLALVKLIDYYKSDENHSRIAVMSLGSFLFRPYGPSDFFQFGLLEVLSEFWSVKHDDRLPTEGFVFTEASNLREFAKNEMCEVFLATQYLRSKGEKLDFTLRHSLLMYKKYFIVLDPSLVDLVWDKYTLLQNRWNQVSFPKPYQEVSEGIWMTLDTSIESLAKLDYLLDMPLKDRDFNPDIIPFSPIDRNRG